MNFKLFALCSLLILTSCGLKTRPRSSNQIVPTIIKEHQKIIKKESKKKKS